MRKIFAVFFIFVLILSLSAPAFAQEAQHSYSSEANSGIRDQVCTTLEGTTVSDYYTGEYTYNSLSGLSGDTLLQSLRTLMTSTHTHQTTYSDCRDLAVKTDCENGDGETINLIYTGYVVTVNEYINNTTDGGGWNREHIWPVSLGGFNKNQTPGCDLHHIRPSDKSVNGQRGNEKYGVPTNGHTVTGTVTVENALGGYSDNTYFEPLDNVKGDVARICLYMYVRYGGEYSGCKSITNVFQSIDVLLQWHESDPVDTWEMGRNEVVYAIQGNRNVFIDYPELAWLMFEREIPEDLMSPSYSQNHGCKHENTELVGVLTATCDADGYTGDTTCLDCGEVIANGEVIAAFGEHAYGRWAVEQAATETENGLKSRTCSICQDKITEQIPSWSTCQHELVTGASNEDCTQLTCKICGYSRWEANADPGPGNGIWVVVGVAAVVVIGGGGAVVILRRKKQ